MSAHCVYPAMSKSPQQLPKCTEKSRNMTCSKCFGMSSMMMAVYHVSTYTVTVSYCLRAFLTCFYFLYKLILYFLTVLRKERLNSDYQQFDQYQQQIITSHLNSQKNMTCSKCFGMSSIMSALILLPFLTVCSK
jgi:uncharacterized membrane protein